MTKILLVEDNEMNRDMLSRRLMRKDYTVVIAVDGQQGVDMAIAERPDIVLMDMSLPVMDGWTATQSLKANPDTAGCDDYDTKPVDLPRLLEKMRALLGT